MNTLFKVKPKEEEAKILQQQAESDDCESKISLVSQSVAPRQQVTYASRPIASPAQVNALLDSITPPQVKDDQRLLLHRPVLAVEMRLTKKEKYILSLDSLWTACHINDMFSFGNEQLGNEDLGKKAANYSVFLSSSFRIPKQYIRFAHLYESIYVQFNDRDTLQLKEIKHILPYMVIMGIILNQMVKSTQEAKHDPSVPFTKHPEFSFIYDGVVRSGCIFLRHRLFWTQCAFFATLYLMQWKKSKDFLQKSSEYRFGYLSPTQWRLLETLSVLNEQALKLMGEGPKEFQDEGPTVLKITKSLPSEMRTTTCAWMKDVYRSVLSESLYVSNSFDSRLRAVRVTNEHMVCMYIKHLVQTREKLETVFAEKNYVDLFVQKKYVPFARQFILDCNKNLAQYYCYRGIQAKEEKNQFLASQFFHNSETYVREFIASCSHIETMLQSTGKKRDVGKPGGFLKSLRKKNSSDSSSSWSSISQTDSKSNEDQKSLHSLWMKDSDREAREWREDESWTLYSMKMILKYILEPRIAVQSQVFPDSSYLHQVNERQVMVDKDKDIKHHEEFMNQFHEFIRDTTTLEAISQSIIQTAIKAKEAHKPDVEIEEEEDDERLDKNQLAVEDEM